MQKTHDADSHRKWARGSRAPGRAICGLLLLLCATPALAQEREARTAAPADRPGGTAQSGGMAVEIVPYVGVFVPTANLVEVAQPMLEFDQKTGVALGGRATLALPGRWDLEGVFLYALSDGRSNDQGEVIETDAHVWAASARALLGLAAPAAPVSFHIGVGLAVIGRGGDAFEGAQNTTDVGGVGGIGLRLNLPGAVKLRADAEDYVYVVKFEGEPGEEFDSELQNDLVLSAGIVIPLGR